VDVDAPALEDATQNLRRVHRPRFDATYFSMQERALVKAGKGLSSPDYIRKRMRDIPTRLNENGVDQFGFDPEYAAKMVPTLAWIYENYFRVEQHNVDLIPDGRCLLISNHSGQLPIDGVMIGMSLFLERTKPRVCRAMIEKFVNALPIVSTFMSRMGQITGTPDNCRRLLDAEESILVFPEGIRGINKLFHERYQLKPFGLGYMRLALEMKAPIVPVAVVGAEEQAPSLMNLKRVGKLFGLPSMPITPLMALGPIGMLPLPVKYRIYFGEPLYFEGDHNDEDSEIALKSAKVERAIKDMLERGLRERKNIFW
jgi:1-acyl-sn-glycerol-3-phosphate acyltransferase